MKYLLLFIIFACSPAMAPKLKVGNCVLGENMEVWQLLRENDGKYLFVQFPPKEGMPVHLVEDLKVFKKVDCPKI